MADRPAFTGRQPVEGQGLAGSAADRLAAGDVAARGGDAPDAAAARDAFPVAPPPPVSTHGVPSVPVDPDLAALVGRDARGPSARGPSAHAPDDDQGDAAWVEGAALAPRPPRRQAVSSTRSDRGAESSRPTPREHVQARGPSWERARRNEAYPTIRTRAGLGSLPGLPRVAVLFGALVIAAVGLFFLPAILGVGSDEDDVPSARPSTSTAPATPTPAPTPIPEPTPQTYTISEGDTLSGIARSFGLSLDDLLAANTETIVDPDRIAVGDVIIIPVPPAQSPDEVPDGGDPSPEPSE